ncbi:MAG TPA: A/G-specific adenine glycosylase [Actinomycetota bacterium]
MARAAVKGQARTTRRSPARKAARPNPARKSTQASARKAAPDIPKAQKRVLAWFDVHGREFPWREQRDAYPTMVAEVMLQQTQTGRVGPSFEAFLKRFPTLSSLAHASAMDVIAAWKGLGYNRRAVNLQRAAQVIEHDHLGIVPEDPKALRALPGIGEYSAHAIACFAYDSQVPVIDVNVSRVLSRAALGMDEDVAPAPKVASAARAWLPSGEAYSWNQALMDIGAMLCRHEHPLCGKCPLRSACVFHGAGKDKRPPAPRPAKEPFEGSRRQKRGGIIDVLRAAAADGITLASLGKVVHPNGEDRDLGWLVELLEGLERDGLVSLTPGARRGSPRGVVRLPA